MQEVVHVKNLLGLVSRVVEYHERVERETGSNFNIFRITKIERLEVNTHSAMIAELLDPKGSHGQGDVFLKEFIKIIGDSLKKNNICKNTIDYNNVRISKEKSFNLGKERIDILLEFNNCILLIENKIDASDGKEQLSRYYNVGLKSKKNFCLLYLTKYGTEANSSSHCGVKYDAISYREDIILWLNRCIKEATLVPIVREGILQYLNLVKKITRVNMTFEFKNEMVELLLEGDNLHHAQKIVDSVDMAKGRALFFFFEKLEALFLNENSEYKIIGNIDSTLIYNKKRCNSWFLKGKKKNHCFGIFIDISKADILLHIEVATHALHYGFVKVKLDSDKENYIILDKPIELAQKFEKRDWQKIKWSSAIYSDNVASNIRLLQEPEKLIEVVIDSIRTLD